MEDSTAMTIDFLRARLLSERSVSRTAKERADELAKRVVELEEQLKSVTLQRKKAEKATVEVLAILENRGISDLSEALDSKFDQENIPCGSKENSNSMKEEESSATSTWARSETEEISGLDLEGSPLSGKNLSWKSCNDTPSLEKKCNDQSGRKQCSFVSTIGSSSKPRTGKSCRQIRRRETISPGDEIGYETFVFDAQEDGGTSGLGDNSDNLEDTLEINKEGSKNEEKAFLDSRNSPKDQERETNAALDLLGNKTNVDMERAVENQVQLIDQNVAQEKAQREWEEKFKENDACTPDSCENGNQSDITEERDDIRETVETMSSHSQGAKSETEEALASGETMTKMLPNVTLSTKSVDAGSSLDQQFKTTSVNEGLSDCWLPSQETPGSTAKGKQKQDWSDTLSCGSSDYQSTKKSSFQADGSEANGESSGNQNELQLTVWQEPPKELGVVLEELQRAKVSLKRQLSRSSMSMKTPSAVRTTETPLPAIEAADVMKIPIGCAGLFRVPTDSQLESTTEANILCPPYCDSDLNVTRYSRKVGGMESDQDRTSHNMEIGSKGSIRRPHFDSYMDVGMTLPDSNRYTYPSYADLLPRMTYKDGAFRSFPSFRPEMPANDHYFLYSERLRSNMHLRY